MVLSWLLNLRSPRVGEAVRVTGGPYADRNGVVTHVDHGRYDVFIDDCCRPTVNRAQLRRVKRRGLGQIIRQARQSDPISEEGRATAEIRDWVDSMGP